MSLLKKVRATIKIHNMLSPGDTVIAGVSGGADSIFLLNVLSELKEFHLKIVVGHINHCLRGEESERDAEFVRKVCKDRGLEFELIEENASLMRKELGKGIEESARIIRYRFFEVLTQKYDADKIATAHTADDQLETVFMRLIRGAGVRGLSGIPYKREPNIIRPLLDITKKEITEYLGENNIQWVEDSTNAEIDYFRNKIRHKLVPVLKELNPQVTQNIQRTAKLFAEKDSFLKEHTEKQFKKVFAKISQGFYSGSLKKFGKAHSFMKLSLLREAVGRVNENLLNMDFDHLEAGLNLLDSSKVSGEINLPNDILIAKSYDEFIVTNKSRINPKFSYTVDDFGEYNFEHVLFKIKKVKAKKLDLGANTALIDPDKFTFPVEIRNLKPGDKFVPFGMKGEKKLKDFFIDEKIPRYLRKLYPLYLVNGEIAWIGGLRLSNRFKVKSREAIRIDLLG